jgi:hypothetical protein
MVAASRLHPASLKSRQLANQLTPSARNEKDRGDALEAKIAFHRVQPIARKLHARPNRSRRKTRGQIRKVFTVNPDPSTP